MTDVVREVQLDGTYTAPTHSTNYNSMTSVARDATAFAIIVLGQHANSSAGVWSKLFYCLRCGDLVAAQSVLKYASPGTEAGVDSVVVELVGMLANMQGDEDCIFGVSRSGDSPSPLGRQTSTLLSPSNSMTMARRAVGDLYEGMKTRYASMSQEQPLAAYRAACLAMLGGNESISEASILETSGLVKTVEDYLYASLWHALHLAEDANSSDVGLKRTCEALARLGTLVKQWGPSYFEQEDEMDGSAASAVSWASKAGEVSSDRIPRSGGWAYALPLLACQQHGTALAYIAEVGGGLGLMQATHLGVVMHAVGIAMGNYTLDSAEGNEENRWRLFPMLAASFSASLQAADVVAALKYLMILSGIGKIMKSQVISYNHFKPLDFFWFNTYSLFY
jgi:nuclear pore complex protein Nup93